MKTPALIPLVALLLTACGPGDDLATAEDADESVDVTSAESALTSELSDEVAQPASASPDQLAQNAATRVASHVQPEGCMTATTAGAKTTYVFDDCTGRYGLVHVTGTVVATYSWAGNGAVQVELISTGLKVNQATIDLNATVKASKSGGVKRAEVTTVADGTGRRGISVHREGEYVVTFDEATRCIGIDGAWSTGRGSSTTVSGYQRCAGACPKSGGRIVHSGARGVTVNVSYDGSATATWSTSLGRSGRVDLKCEAF